MDKSITLPAVVQHPSLEDDMMLYALNIGTDINLNITMTSNSSAWSLHRLVIRCFSLYALALVIIGTLGNLLTIIILCRRNLRRYVTMRYLIAVSVCDILSLYGWNLNNFYKFTISTNDTNLEEISLVHCRVVSYLTFVGLQLSSWCLTAVSLDRCLSLYFLAWKQKYGKLSRTKYHIALLTVTCLLLNSHILFFNGYRTDPPNYSVKCYATRTNSLYIFPQWERVHLVIYNLCPFIIMLACNVYIIYVTIRSARIRTRRTVTMTTVLGKRTRSNSSRHRQLSVMLMLVTFAFVLLTLPSCIYFVFFRHRMTTTNSSRSYRHMVQICLSSVQFTSHGINFFLYCFSATNFRNELKDFMREIFFCCSMRSQSHRLSSPATTFRQDTMRKSRRKSSLIPAVNGQEMADPTALKTMLDNGKEENENASN